MPRQAPLHRRLAAWPLLALLAAWAFAPGAAAQDARRKQDILFDEIPGRSAGDAPFEVTVTASSGLPVALQIISGPAVLDGKKVTLTGAPGLVVIRASQEGNPQFLPANAAERAFAVRAKPSAPVILSQPMGQSAAIGEAVRLAIDAEGEPAPSYQWRKDGVPITGATDRSFGVAVASPTDAGTYDAVVSNSVGSVTSDRVRVSVGKRSQVLVFQNLGSPATAGQPIALTASATSGLPVQFQIQSGAGFLSGNLLTCQGGTVVVQATQPGDSSYEAAAPVEQTFVFSPSPGLAHP
jgi:large repetitive protein